MDKGQRPQPNVDLRSFLETPAAHRHDDSAGSPSRDWRNILERSPDDPSLDKQHVSTDDDSVTVVAMRRPSWFDRRTAAHQARDLPKNGDARDARATNQSRASLRRCTAHSERRSEPTRFRIARRRRRSAPSTERVSAWFDSWLHGQCTRDRLAPRIQYYTIGAMHGEVRCGRCGHAARRRFVPRSDSGANTDKGNGRLSLARRGAANVRTRSRTIRRIRCRHAAARSAARAIRRTFRARRRSADIEQRPTCRLLAATC